MKRADTTLGAGRILLWLTPFPRFTDRPCATLLGETVSVDFGPGKRRISFGDLQSVGEGRNGAGGILIDDIIVRRFNKAPVVEITEPDTADPAPLTGLPVAGKVTDEGFDTVQRLEYRVGEGNWIEIPRRQRYWSDVVDTPLDPPTEANWYWFNVRASDGDRVGYSSVKFCNHPTSGACTSALFTHQTIGTQMSGSSEE